MSVFNENKISIPQIAMPASGNQGQSGTLNGLGLSGAVFLKISTARQIITKEVNVPKLHSAADIFKSMNNAQTITINPDNQVKT